MKRNILSILMLVAFLVSACGGPAASPAPEQPANNPNPTAVPATSVPAATQAPSGIPFTGKGISFSIPTGLGTSDLGNLVPAVVEGGPADTPAFMRFKIQGYPLPGSPEINEAEIRVYRTSEYAALAPGGSDSVTKVAMIMDTNVPLTKDNMPHPGMLSSNIQLLSLQNVTGVRKVSALGMQGVMPVSNQYLSYQFHGMTADKRYFIWVNLPISAAFIQTTPESAVPTGGEPMPDMNSANFNQEFNDYLGRISSKLDEAEKNGTLNPSIAQLDALVQSIVLDPTALESIPTPPPYPTQPAEPTATTAPATACNAAQFIDDVTVEDDTKFDQGQSFRKTWRLKNIGSCTWNISYRLYYVNGDGPLAPQEEYYFSEAASKTTVAPGETVDVSIDMTASGTADATRRSFWGLKDDAGKVIFVSSAMSSGTFYVQIKIKNNTSSSGFPNITPNIIRVFQSNTQAGDCTDASWYLIQADITSDRPATVEFLWYSNNMNGTFDVVNGQVVFDQAGTKRVETTLKGPYENPTNILISFSTNLPGVQPPPALQHLVCKDGAFTGK